MADSTNQVGRCGTCKHWGCKNEESDRVRACQIIGHVGTIYNRAVLEQGAVAGTLDGDGFGAWLVSSADFGCVLHKPTTKENHGDN